MYITKEELLNGSEFKIFIGCMIAFLIIAIFIIIYLIIIKPRLALKKLEKYERVSKRGSLAVTPNNRNSLMLCNARMSQIPRVSLLKLEDPMTRISIIPEGTLPKDVQVPPKRYTPFTFDLTRLSILDVKYKESNRF